MNHIIIQWLEEAFICCNIQQIYCPSNVFQNAFIWDYLTLIYQKYSIKEDIELICASLSLQTEKKKRFPFNSKYKLFEGYKAV